VVDHHAVSVEDLPANPVVTAAPVLSLAVAQRAVLAVDHHAVSVEGLPARPVVTAVPVRSLAVVHSFKAKTEVLHLVRKVEILVLRTAATAAIRSIGFPRVVKTQARHSVDHPETRPATAIGRSAVNRGRKAVVSTTLATMDEIINSIRRS
jgi:hypothetical protein